MISDEMRELLSAYVDGELRDADALRVEDASKRDPELRREIDAYRTLRRKLREWDVAEHGALPSPSLLGSTLARARSMDAALSAPARLRFLGPLAAAAGLLVAAGAGFLLARSTAPEAPSHPEAGTPVALKPLEPLQDLALEGSALAEAPKRGPAPLLARLDDHLPSRRALEFEDAARREEFVRAAPAEPERKTETPRSAEISAMVGGFAPFGQPNAALVVISRLPTLRALGPVAPAKGRARDSSEARIMPRQGPAAFTPLGEIWMGTDRRVRLSALSSWITPGADTLVPVVWADEMKASTDVEAQDVVLGPRARQRLLAAKPGLDADFLAWLREAYGKKPLATRLADDGRDRDRAVNKLVDALAKSKDATGFAVLDAKGALLGTELFLDHEMMLAFAPRLLRGYLLEAGEDGIRVAPPAGALPAAAEVARLLEGMPARGLRVEREKLDVVFGDSEGEAKQTMRAPDGVARVTLYAAGQPVGHGLVHHDTPIHLTLFGE